MKIAICDDNKKCNERLRKMLLQYARSKELDECDIVEYDSGAALLERYSKGVYDIIFLDVEMPLINGFNTAEAIREEDLDVDIVFITYMKDDVQKGFDYNAKGYLYKDVTQEQIDERIDKLINERFRGNENAFYRIKLKKGGTVLLSLPRILYFESVSHDISAVSEAETYVFLDTITNLSKKLESNGFIRVSQSHLVNINHVFNMSGNQVTIKKGKDITVGRSFKQALTEAFKMKEMSKWKP